MVLKQYGIETLEKGITEEMRDEVDEICGEPNRQQSYDWLVVCVQCVAGYEGRWEPVEEEERKSTATKQDSNARPFLVTEAGR